MEPTASAASGGNSLLQALIETVLFIAQESKSVVLFIFRGVDIANPLSFFSLSVLLPLLMILGLVLYLSKKRDGLLKKVFVVLLLVTAFVGIASIFIGGAVPAQIG